MTGLSWAVLLLLVMSLGGRRGLQSSGDLKGLEHPRWLTYVAGSPRQVPLPSCGLTPVAGAPRGKVSGLQEEGAFQE